MDCLCYRERDKKKNSTTKLKKEYRERIKEITYLKLDLDGKNIDIECNHILCEKSVKSGLEKNVLLNNNHYTFCSEDCWNDWLSSGQNLRHYARPSLLFNSNSPEYLKL